jgi:hypothetical protein
MIKVAKKKVLTVKKKLMPLLSLKEKYSTTYKDIKKFFKILNEGLFDNKLIPFNDIEIKELKYQRCMGQVIQLDSKRKGTRVHKLEMDTKYDTKKDFLDTLAHEMVHLYQFTQLNDNGAHNKLFYSFSPKLKVVGLKL